MLPLKMRVFQYVAQKGVEVNADDVLVGLASEYQGEKQFKRKRIEDYLDALAAVGMIKETEIAFNEKGDITISYEATKLGKERLRYIPENYKELPEE